MITVNPIVATLPSPTPGQAVSGYVEVVAPQADRSFVGSFDVVFAGETAAGDITVGFSEPEVPTVAGYELLESQPDVDYRVEFGVATSLGGDRWQIPWTVTAIDAA